MYNLQTFKVILRSFELALVFKVKFVKSNVFGVNVWALFGFAESFLHWKVGKLPFKYLGLSVGARSKR